MTVPSTPVSGAARSGNASWVLSQDGRITVVTVEGKLDSTSAGPIASALAAVGADASDVILDMAHLDVIDLEGLDALARVRRLFEILGLSLTLRRPSPAVRSALGLLQLEDLIKPTGSPGVPVGWSGPAAVK
jgi:anti-anti-sigma factor